MLSASLVREFIVALTYTRLRDTPMQSRNEAPGSPASLSQSAMPFSPSSSLLSPTLSQSILPTSPFTSYQVAPHALAMQSMLSCVPVTTCDSSFLPLKSASVCTLELMPPTYANVPGTRRPLKEYNLFQNVQIDNTSNATSSPMKSSFTVRFADLFRKNSFPIFNAIEPQSKPENSPSSEPLPEPANRSVIRSVSNEQKTTEKEIFTPNQFRDCFANHVKAQFPSITVNDALSFAESLRQSQIFAVDHIFKILTNLVEEKSPEAVFYLEKFYVALKELNFPLPAGFAPLFANLAFHTLPPRYEFKRTHAALAFCLVCA
jgi:hypothetical protein